MAYDIAPAGGGKGYHFSEPGTQSSSGRQVSRVGTLDLDAIPSGEYLLTVRVSDLVGKHERSVVGRFRKSD